ALMYEQLTDAGFFVVSKTESDVDSATKPLNLPAMFGSHIISSVIPPPLEPPMVYTRFVSMFWQGAAPLHSTAFKMPFARGVSLQRTVPETPHVEVPLIACGM